MEPHTCNLSIQRLRQEDLAFKASMGYIVKPCPQKRMKKKIALSISVLFTPIIPD
jgi:hypothetical protein